MIGTLLNDRYRVDAELGRGGMGVVYRAYDTLLERDVAVKVVSAAFLSAEGRARLLNEARSAARLNHPNIVSVHDAGESDGVPFIVIELVEGGESLHSRRLDTLEEILVVARQVCAALDHAHAQGVVHRDIKPANVLISPDGTVKLSDFGLARPVASRITMAGTITGTVDYLAPEQALGQELDGRVDLYALGVMLYKLTTGRLPFEGDDLVTIISQHLYAPVVPPRAKNPKIPPALDALIVRLLGKSPGDRPASAGEVEQMLRRIGAPAAPTGVAPIEELAVLDRVVRGRLVGRKQELAEARALWKKAATGAGQVLLIGGESGIGKTRLVRELATQVQVSGGRALVGTCYAEGGAPYAPFAQILRQTLLNGDDEGLDLPTFVLADLLTLAPDLCRYYPDVSPNPALDPQSEQQRLFENVVSFCAALSERAPLLLLLDDAHWADSSTLSLLRHLARRIRRQRLLIVATYRDVELDQTRPFREVLLDLSRERLASRMKLSRLGKEETKELLATLLDEEITPEFLEGIYRETEGNPFFVEEVTKALVESGKLYFQEGRWHRPSMAELEIPQSVRVAVQSRVGRLPQSVQETLRLAAILGREFDCDTLAEASGLDEDALVDVLEVAEQAQLIEEVGGRKRVTFAFAHALIPTTLAEGVRTLRRRRLHRRVAVAIEKISPDDFEALAYHYGQAGNEEWALIYYTRAGERAAAAYANQEAEQYYLSALDLVEAKADRAYLLAELGEMQSRQSRYEDAIKTWREGIAAYEVLEDREGVARLYARAARAAWYAGDTPRSLALCREGMRAVAGAADSPEVANLLHETARACFFSVLLEEAESLCRQALEMAERLGAVVVQAEVLTTLAILPGQPIEEAVAALTRAVELAESAKLLVQADRAHNNLAAILTFYVGDLQAARRHYLRAAELSRQRGNVAGELFRASGASYTALFQGEIAVVEAELSSRRQLRDSIYDPGRAAFLFLIVETLLLRYRGELLEAIERLRALQTAARDADDLQNLSALAFLLAEALLEVGEEEEAEAALHEAIAVGDRGTIYGGVGPRCVLSMLRSHQGEIAAARDLISEGHVKAAQSRAWDMIWLSLAEAHLATAERDWPGAWAAFENTVDGLARMGMRWYRARTLREWAEAHLSRGEPEDGERAGELLREAVVEFKRMGNPFYAARVEVRLEELEELV